MLKQMILIYGGIGGLMMIALLSGGAGWAEKCSLLLLFGVIAEQIVSIVKNLWF